MITDFEFIQYDRSERRDNWNVAWIMNAGEGYLNHAMDVLFPDHVDSKEAAELYTEQNIDQNQEYWGDDDYGSASVAVEIRPGQWVPFQVSLEIRRIYTATVANEIAETRKRQEIDESQDGTAAEGHDAVKHPPQHGRCVNGYSPGQGWLQVSYRRRCCGNHGRYLDGNREAPIIYWTPLDSPG